MIWTGTLDALLAASAHCSDGFMDLSIITPMSRSESTASNFSPFMRYAKFLLLRPTCRTLHFLTLNSIHHLEAQFVSLVRQSCSLSLSSSFTILCPSFVSSANLLIWRDDFENLFSYGN